MTTKPDDPLALIEHAQKVIAAPDAPLPQLDECKLSLERVIADGSAEIEGISNRRTIEIGSLSPAAALDKALDDLDRREKAVARRVLIAQEVSRALGPRIAAAREAEAAARRQDAYNEAEKLVTALASRFEAFLGHAAPEASALLADYAAVQTKVSEVNRNLPPNAAPVRSLEQRRTREPQTRGTVVRRVKFFYLGNDRIVEVGRAEAAETSAGVWGVFVPSGSVQGGETFAGCRIVEFLELKVETLKSQPESLLTALRIPQFHEPYVTAGTSRRTVPAAEWDAANGQPVPRLAAE
jgi:hypothetical protein